MDNIDDGVSNPYSFWIATACVFTAINCFILCISATARNLVGEWLGIVFLAFLSFVVLGVPVGFIYLGFRGVLWLTSCLGEAFPSLKEMLVKL